MPRLPSGQLVLPVVPETVCCTLLVPKHTCTVFLALPPPKHWSNSSSTSSSDIFILSTGTFSWLSKFSPAPGAVMAISIELCVLLLYAWIAGCLWTSMWIDWMGNLYSLFIPWWDLAFSCSIPGLPPSLVRHNWHKDQKALQILYVATGLTEFGPIATVHVCLRDGGNMQKCNYEDVFV